MRFAAETGVEPPHLTAGHVVEIEGRGWRREVAR